MIYKICNFNESFPIQCKVSQKVDIKLFADVF